MVSQRRRAPIVLHATIYIRTMITRRQPQNRTAYLNIEDG
jgi:hypothetical protein